MRSVGACCVLRTGRPLAMLTLVTVFWGCARFTPQQLAADYGFSSSVERGAPFLHQLFFRPGEGDRLHVYIEGDGRPWLSPGRIALDPTGRRQLMLELAALDPAPVLFLGRPCYLGVADPRCTPEWWTFLRYSESVVASMNAVLERRGQNYSGLSLFGFSGGGTLAMLLAARREDVLMLVTLAGNLDIDAWIRYHDYTPLTGSLNPALQPPLPAAVRQYHLLGERDENITREMIEPVIATQGDAELRMLPGYDHRCCWGESWPRVLVELSTGAGARRAPRSGP